MRKSNRDSLRLRPVHVAKNSRGKNPRDDGFVRLPFACPGINKLWAVGCVGWGLNGQQISVVILPKIAPGRLPWTVWMTQEKDHQSPDGFDKFKFDPGCLRSEVEGGFGSWPWWPRQASLSQQLGGDLAFKRRRNNKLIPPFFGCYSRTSRGWTRFLENGAAPSQSNLGKQRSSKSPLTKRGQTADYDAAVRFPIGWERLRYFGSRKGIGR